jgi:hypothetical protein
LYTAHNPATMPETHTELRTAIKRAREVRAGKNKNHKKIALDRIKNALRNYTGNSEYVPVNLKDIEDDMSKIDGDITSFEKFVHDNIGRDELDLVGIKWKPDSSYINIYIAEDDQKKEE